MGREGCATPPRQARPSKRDARTLDELHATHRKRNGRPADSFPGEEHPLATES